MSIRRVLPVSIVLLVLLACVALWQSSVRSDSDDDGDDGEGAFGRRIAGTYFLEVQHEGFPLALALVTLTRDGGFIANDTSDMGAGGLVNHDGPVQGTWKRIDRRTVAARTLYFAYDDNGIPKWIARTTGEFIFERGFHRGIGTLKVERFHLNQDPLDDDEEPHDELNATLTARRVTVD